MQIFRKPVAMWIIGAGALLIAVLGTIAAGAIVWVPVALVYAALSYPQSSVLTVLLYSAVIWLPLGFGAGIATFAKFMKGYLASDPRED